VKNIGIFTSKFVTKEARKRGFAEAAVLQKWQQITPAHGRYTIPEKLFKGTLTIAVPSDSAKLAVQMDSAVLIQSMNQFFGYEAVKKIRFVLRQFNFEQKVAQKIQEPTDADRNRAMARCAGIEDLQLRERMIKLGALIEMENVRHLDEK
jgi:hypothetical protein